MSGSTPSPCAEKRSVWPGPDAAARAFDLAVLALVALPTIAVMLAVALAIKLESPGPVFYRAVRVGRGGRRFAMLKFRKMQAEAEGPPLTSAEDARFTRIGKFLARTKLDELPQVINVARGEMHLVGPRPESPDFVRHHADLFDRILTVAPGMTGPTQLRYFREYLLLVDADETHYATTILPAKLAGDIGYLETRTLRGDAGILGQTARTIAVGAVSWLVGWGRDASLRPSLIAGLTSALSLIGLLVAGRA